MFRPVSLFVALRYTRAKRRNHFISFISLTSMLGIALGVAVLITVLSVMNGFDSVIRDHFFSMAQQVSIRGITGKLSDTNWIQKNLATQANIQASVPFIEGQGLLSANGQTSAVLSYGILPEAQPKVSPIASKMISGALANLKPNHFGIVLGIKLANNLGLTIGDKVTLIVPTATLTPAGIFPRFKVFTVVGIFKTGNGFGYDSQFAYLHLQDAQKLFLLGKAISGLALKISDFYAAPAVATRLRQVLPAGYLVSDWTQDYGIVFDALKLEKTMMFFILVLIVAVAAFNLVSTLVMTVTDKRSDIAILKTLGATSGLILRIFMIQGMIIGIIGTLIGLIGGSLLSFYATDIADILQKWCHVQLLSSDVYYVNYLPSELLATDIIKVCFIALLLSFLATIYPAWRASATQPAEALRYD